MESFLSYVRDAVRSCPEDDSWHIETATGSDSRWIHVARNERTPAQGWKLHVSANHNTAVETLRRILPVLLRDTASFKVAASSNDLNELNEGRGGLSQVGKFVTVYPEDDAQAVRLAAALDQASQGLAGPGIPSDRPLRMGSIVHYRYGGFRDSFIQTMMGQIVPALRTPNGDFVPDQRRTRYAPPDWAIDPFLAAGVADELVGSGRLVGGRYLSVATLYESARGAILSGVDVLTPRTCIIKQARLHTLVGRDGRDACDRLRHEMKILNQLAPDDRVPRVLDIIEQKDDLFLVMTDLEGVTLEHYVREFVTRGRLPSREQLLNLACSLARLLRMIHERGILYRDLKSSNIMVDANDKLRILDFELAVEIGSGMVGGRGTRGYFSPQQHEDQTPTVADDVYGFGAVLYFLATGAEPSLAPDPFRLQDRPIMLLNPEAPPPLVRLVERCLQPDPCERFSSMAAVEEALAEWEAEQVRSVQCCPYKKVGVSAGEKHVYRGLAIRLGDTLCRVARSEPDNGLSWRSTHENQDGISARDLCIGSAGPVLALAGLVSKCGEPAHRDALRRGAAFLARSQPSPGGSLPGLYVGEAGVGAALLLAGHALNDPDLIGAALDKGRLIASMPYLSPDLYNGTAGRLRFHLWLWHAMSDAEQLQYARHAGAEILKSAEDDGGEACWTIPPGYDGLSGSAYIGYAHGAAGIADALLDLFEVTADQSFADAVRRAGDWIARHAFETLGDSSGLDWPDVSGGASIGPFWCHGAAGVGRFFLHAAQLGTIEGARLYAVRAARSAAKGARWSSPTQCHGLAGNIEFLLDMFQSTNDEEYLHEALLLGQLLQRFALESPGALVWPSESPEVITPDYMVGYAGVAAALLRLSDPDRLPHQLSRSGFSHKFVASPAQMVGAS